MTRSVPTAVPFPEDEEAVLSLGRALRETGYSFTTVTPATHAHVNARPRNAEARSLRDVFGWSRPFRADLV
ncbi:SAM-dependent methyltransferase, partial [Methylobacterium radiotolerans]